MQEIIIFARDMCDGLAEANKGFDKRRRIIELLDVRAVLAGCRRAVV